MIDEFSPDTFNVVIRLEGTAFDETNGSEVGRILRGIADQLDGTNVQNQARHTVSLFDINGNRVGQYKVG